MDRAAVGIMTARVMLNDCVYIDLLPGESPKEELKKYLLELERAGHMMRVDAPAPHGVNIPRKMLCTRCKLSVRTYVHDLDAHFFSDFGEGTECGGTQLSVMTLCR